MVKHIAITQQEQQRTTQPVAKTYGSQDDDNDTHPAKTYGSQDDDNDTHPQASTAQFMSKYDIKLHNKDNIPILTPFQFLYPTYNHHINKIKSNKFQKAEITATCKSEDTIFTFYNTVRHIVGSFNILLLPLKDIVKATGECQFTPLLHWLRACL